MFTYYTYKRHFRKKAIKTQIKAHNHKTTQQKITITTTKTKMTESQNHEL